MNTEQYIQEITVLLESATDKGLLDLIYNLLIKSVQVAPQ